MGWCTPGYMMREEFQRDKLRRRTEMRAWGMKRSWGMERGELAEQLDVLGESEEESKKGEGSGKVEEGEKSVL